MGQEQSAYLSEKRGYTDDSRSVTTTSTALSEEVSGFDTTHVEWEGYMEKKGHVLRHWKPRFCTLEGNTLSYYENKEDAVKRRHLKGRLHISDVQLEEKKDNSRGYDFIIDTVERKKFHCSIACDMERRVWVRMMEAGVDAVLFKTKGRPKFQTHNFLLNYVPDETLYSQYKKVLMERRGMEDFVFYFSKDLILTSNYPRALAFGGDFYGREGLVAFCELYTRNLKVYELNVESVQPHKRKTIVQGTTLVRSRADRTEILERWTHEIRFGPGGDKITKITMKIDLEKAGDAYAALKATATPFVLKDDHNRVYHTRRALALSMNDFTVHHVIGKGGFGTVVVAKKKSDGRVYAIKILDKLKMTKYDVESSFTEMNIGQTIHHPFIASLQLAFQSRSKLFLGMKFYAGGDLFHHMSRGATCKIAPARAKFYGAELMLAIHHLHKHDILYRDLKPENVMIDASGHIGLVDFGLAKMHVQDYKGAKTMAGSPQYTAPELLAPKEQRQYGKMIDWWSLGVLIYEMSCGKSPFFDSNIDRMYKKIKEEPVKFPENQLVSEELKDLLRGLLCKDPTERLGQKFSEIKDHPFYRGLDWDKLLAKEIVPPWKPNIKSDTCVDYVDQEFADLDPEKEIRSPAAPARGGAGTILGSAFGKLEKLAKRAGEKNKNGKKAVDNYDDDALFRDFVYDCQDPNALVKMDDLLHEIQPTPRTGGTPLAAFVASGKLEYPVEGEEEETKAVEAPGDSSDDESKGFSSTDTSLYTVQEENSQRIPHIDSVQSLDTFSVEPERKETASSFKDVLLRGQGEGQTDGKEDSKQEGQVDNEGARRLDKEGETEQENGKEATESGQAKKSEEMEESEPLPASPLPPNDGGHITSPPPPPGAVPQNS